LIEVLTIVKDEAVDLVLSGPRVPAVLHATGLSIAIMPVTREEKPVAARDEPPEDDPSYPEFSDEDELDPPDEPEAEILDGKEAVGPENSCPGSEQLAGPTPTPPDGAGGSA